MKFTNDLIGTTIYGYPTGNNAMRGVKTQKPVLFTVEKISRKYVTLTVVGRNYSDKYLPETGATQSQIQQGYCSNAGYIFKKTLTEYEEIDTHKQLVVRLTRVSWTSLDLDILQKVAHILKDKNVLMD